MTSYAIVSGVNIVNTVESDSLPALQFFFPNATIVERNQENGFGGVGGTFSDGYLYPFKQYSSWVWSGSYWEPPIPMPDSENFYVWVEDELRWEQVTLEE